MSSRTDILANIRRSLARKPRVTSQSPADRLAALRPGVQPSRGRLPADRRLALFMAEAVRADATAEAVASFADVPGRVAAYLARHNLGAALRVAPLTRRDNIPWSKQPLLTPDFGPPRPEDSVGVGAAFAGVAETGTLVIQSGPESPTRLNVLPPTHIVVLRASAIVGTYEDVWARLRTERASKDGPTMPRTVNWITGPSRTADIEQTLLLGAHGPQRLHILIVNDLKDTVADGGFERG
ncbi:MAG: lactate utilization protein C [Rhodospirillales bacterium]|nr:lactate utilization protein C [Rhodospirillales bacterium]